MNIRLIGEFRGRCLKNGRRLWMVVVIDQGHLSVHIEDGEDISDRHSQDRQTHKEKVFVYDWHIQGTQEKMTYDTLLKGFIPPVALESMVVPLLAHATRKNKDLKKLLDYWTIDSALAFGTLVRMG